MQSIALYGAETWWRDQAKWEQEIQTIVNRQGRTITGMFRTAPVGVVIKEAGLRPAISLLNNRQRRYAQRLLSLPNENAIRNILPETLRDGDAYAEPGDQELSNWDWLSISNAKNLGNRLASSLIRGIELDTSYGIENTEKVLNLPFPATIKILPNATDAKRYAIEHLNCQEELSSWTDGSKLENQRAGAAVVWKMLNGRWNTRKIYLGKNKEIFDAELYGIDQALDIALRAGRPRARQTSWETMQN